jgi:hypothetical protein
MIYGLAYMVMGLEFKVPGLWFRVRIQDAGFTV